MDASPYTSLSVLVLGCARNSNRDSNSCLGTAFGRSIGLSRTIL